MSTSQRRLWPPLIAALALLLAACTSAAPSAPKAAPAPTAAAAAAPTVAPAAPPTSPPPREAVRIPYAAPSLGSLPLWLTYDGGYFEREGLDVTMDYVASGTTLAQALLSGDVPLASAGEEGAGGRGGQGGGRGVGGGSPG